MGWWSETIMGGDRPCDVIALYEEDIVGDLSDAEIKACDNEEAFLLKYRELVNSKLEELLQSAKTDEYECEEIAGQVLGVFILCNGANMPDHIRAYILESIDADTWDHKDYKRQVHLNNFRLQIEAYPSNGGVIVDVEHESLFDVMSSDVEPDGLINKNI